jgi:hypothetical protein
VTERSSRQNPSVVRVGIGRRTPSVIPGASLTVRFSGFDFFCRPSFTPFPDTPFTRPKLLKNKPRVKITQREHCKQYPAGPVNDDRTCDGGSLSIEFPRITIHQFQNWRPNCCWQVRSRTGTRLDSDSPKWISESIKMTLRHAYVFAWNCLHYRKQSQNTRNNHRSHPHFFVYLFVVCSTWCMYTCIFTAILTAYSSITLYIFILA